MTAPTYQQVLNATQRVELHHFAGTAVVVCCLVTTDGKAILGVGAPQPGQEFDVANLAGRARAAADGELAKQLQMDAELKAVQWAMQPGGSSVLDSAPQNVEVLPASNEASS